jgi:hypothetical protein
MVIIPINPNSSGNINLANTIETAKDINCIPNCWEYVHIIPETAAFLKDNIYFNLIYYDFITKRPLSKSVPLNVQY